MDVTRRKFFFLGALAAGGLITSKFLPQLQQVETFTYYSWDWNDVVYRSRKDHESIEPYYVSSLEPVWKQTGERGLWVRS